MYIGLIYKHEQSILQRKEEDGGMFPEPSLNFFFFFFFVHKNRVYNKFLAQGQTNNMLIWKCLKGLRESVQRKITLFCMLYLPVVYCLVKLYSKTFCSRKNSFVFFSQKRRPSSHCVLSTVYSPGKLKV